MTDGRGRGKMVEGRKSKRLFSFLIGLDWWDYL